MPITLGPSAADGTLKTRFCGYMMLVLTNHQHKTSVLFQCAQTGLGKRWGLTQATVQVQDNMCQGREALVLM